MPSTGKRATASKAERAERQPPFEINGTAVAAGENRKIDVPVARLPTQTMLSMPVMIVHGLRRGPRLWVSAAIHGDEINGVEIVRQVLESVSARDLTGTLVAVPIVNVFGFIHQSRYLPDRRDLNRSFPGSPRGSLAARLAHLFMTEVVSRCSHGIDLHTASHDRSNYPHVRANLDDEETRRCAHAFAAPLTIHSHTRDGSLREAVTERGIPILLYEAGEALRFDEEAIRVGVRGIRRVMAAIGMNQPLSDDEAPDTVEVRQTRWVRASRSGILRTRVREGERVDEHQVLALVSDAFGTRSYKVKSPCAGIVIGQTRNPLVNRGDGIFHLALHR